MPQSRPKTMSARPRRREAISDHMNLSAPSRYVSLPGPYGLFTVTIPLESEGCSQAEAPLHVEISDILRQSMKRYRFVTSPGFLVKQIFCP